MGSARGPNASRGRRRALALPLAVCLGLWGWGRGALAQGPALVPPPPVEPLPPPPPSAVMVEQPEPAPVRVPPPPPGPDFRIGAGYRLGLISDPSYDAFADDDVLSQLSLDATYAVVNGRRAALAVGAAWDFGSRATTADGLDASIRVHRFVAPIEGRLIVAPWAYVFGRIAPGAATYDYRVASTGAPLEGNPWVFATDFSAGGSILLWPHGALDQRVARVWFTPEVGYGWTASSPIDLESRRQPILVATAPDRLEPLALRGAFFRAQIALTF